MMIARFFGQHGFEKHYAGMKVKRIIVHPAGTIASAASFTHDVDGMREVELRRWVKRLRDFFKSFEAFNFKDLSATRIQQLIDAHELSVSSLLYHTEMKLKDLK